MEVRLRSAGDRTPSGSVLAIIGVVISFVDTADVVAVVDDCAITVGTAGAVGASIVKLLVGLLLVGLLPPLLSLLLLVELSAFLRGD